MKKKQICDLLHISRPTLDKYFDYYSKELEQFVIRRNGRFVDFDSDGIEVLRNIAKSEPKEANFDKKIRELEQRISELSSDVEKKDFQLRANEELINQIKSSNEELIADKRNLQSENELLKSKNEKISNHFIVKLLGWNKD